MKKFLNEWNLIFLVFGILSIAIIVQMWYIYKIKSELKLFNEREHVIINYIEINKNTYSDTIKIKCIDSTSNKLKRRQYSERGALNWD